MISTITDGSSQVVRGGLLNVGQKVEEALAKKNELYTAIYEVSNSLLTTKQLFKITGSFDMNGYAEVMKHIYSDHRIYSNYVLRVTGALTGPVNHRTMLDLVYPRGLMTYCATINETLSFVGCHKSKVKRLLSGGRRIVFVGDVGRAPITHVGFVIMVNRRIRFHREFVTSRTEYLPTDLFITRYIL